MPSHIKMALTRTSESIPIQNGQLALGTWQGIFLWEHRAVTHNRLYRFKGFDSFQAVNIASHHILKALLKIHFRL